MAANDNISTPPPPQLQIETSSSLSPDELAAKAVQKRYEGLMTVRAKAVKGKGAWYWAHLEPLLVHNNETGLPKSVKLRCSLCDAVFSASNPSRTSSEHLKRGTCPNFNSLPKPISSVSPSAVPSPSTMVIFSPSSSTSPRPLHNSRKRSSSSGNTTSTTSGAGNGGGASAFTSPSQRISPLAMVEPSRFCGETSYSQAMSTVTTVVSMSVAGAGGGEASLLPQNQQLVLSGGKEDLDALAMLEDSVKKLKSPKTSPGQALSRAQVAGAFDFLSDWLYESCGSVSFSSLGHPKFRAFVNQVGLPAVPLRELTGSRLDSKYQEAKAESENRVREAMFFQISSDGWKHKRDGSEDNLVNLSLNLPNGTSVFQRAVFVTSSVPSNYAEEVLWETITSICSSGAQQCVGIVADKFKANALRNLEKQHHWMVNLSCQFQGFSSLIKDFAKNLPLFNNASQNCLKLASFVMNDAQIRSAFNKYQVQEYGQSGLIRIPFKGLKESNFEHVLTMMKDILNSARALHLLLSDESYKIVAMEDQIAREVEEMVRDMGFWNELEAVHSLVKLVKEMVHQIERERPLIGQCLPLWDELRRKVKKWCAQFRVPDEPVDNVINRRFNKNYHPAWAASFILDPLYLTKETSGRYLPPFKCLTSEQEKDVDKLITRLVSREEAHIALMELMKWRSEGLEPVYAKAVQMKDRDPVTGKMKLANPQSSRLVWETYLTEFKALGKVAVRLIFLHATSRGFKFNWPLSKWGFSHGNTRAGMEKAQKLIFISAHSKLQKGKFSGDDDGDDKDAEMFALANGY